MSDARPLPFRAYLVTDEESLARPDALAHIEAALAAFPPGLAALQLRAKHLDGRALLDAARALAPLARRHGALLFVNSRLDVALAAGADGVHLPAAGLPPDVARRLAPRLLIGASTHSLAEARAAAHAGADFVSFGPVYATPSKARYGEPLGLASLAEAVRALAIPVFALGGVTLDTAPACLAVGARVACIRAVLGDDDPARAAAALSSLLA